MQSPKRILGDLASAALGLTMIAMAFWLSWR